MKKVSVTLDARLIAQAKRRARSKGLSAYVDEALRLRLQNDRIGELLDELDSIYGPVSAEVTAQTEEAWLKLAGGKRNPKQG